MYSPKILLELRIILSSEKNFLFKISFNKFDLSNKLINLGSVSIAIDIE